MRDGQKIWESDVLLMGAEGAENVVVVDEAAIEISADTQDKDKEKNSGLFGLVALSRHAGLDIYFLAQKMTHVAKKVRDLAETRTMCSNCANIPVAGWFLKRFFGDLRRTVYKDGTLFGSVFLRLKPEICEFYQTHGMRQQLELKAGGQRIKKESDWNRRSMIFIGGGLLICLVIMSWGGWKTYTSLNTQDEGKREVEEAPRAVTKVQRYQPDGTTKEVLLPDIPPPPKGGIMLEWDAYDEHVLAGVVKSRGAKVVVTRGGRRLYAGGSYEGQRIQLQFQVSDWHYFQCENKRVIVVRPMRPEEREGLPPVTIPGSRNTPVDIPAGPGGGILAGLNDPLL
jgi:hypothetical protein